VLVKIVALQQQEIKRSGSVPCKTARGRVSSVVVA
jgi:hypothetical protein